MIYNFTIILGHENNYKKKLNYFTFWKKLNKNEKSVSISVSFKVT